MRLTYEDIAKVIYEGKTGKKWSRLPESLNKYAWIDTARQLVSYLMMRYNELKQHKEDNMPAKSIKQRRAMAIAEHHPEELNKKNKGLKKMSKSQLHDFAATKETKLPVKVKKRK